MLLQVEVAPPPRPETATSADSGGRLSVGPCLRSDRPSRSGRLRTAASAPPERLAPPTPTPLPPAAPTSSAAARRGRRQRFLARRGSVVGGRPARLPSGSTTRPTAADLRATAAAGVPGRAVRRVRGGRRHPAVRLRPALPGRLPRRALHEGAPGRRLVDERGASDRRPAGRHARDDHQVHRRLDPGPEQGHGRQGALAVLARHPAAARRGGARRSRPCASDRRARP